MEIEDTGYLVRGFIHEHPVYDNGGNWTTKVGIGDVLVCGFGGFGSEVLNYGQRYKVIKEEGEIKLESENGSIIDAWHTKNTMPFFVKLLQK